MRKGAPLHRATPIHGAFFGWVPSPVLQQLLVATLPTVAQSSTAPTLSGSTQLVKNPDGPLWHSHSWLCGFAFLCFCTGRPTLRSGAFAAGYMSNPPK